LNFKREKLNKRLKEKDKKTYLIKTKKLNHLLILHLKLKRPEIKERTKMIKRELTN
jgi:hypothetical protein